jgi:hypothetical protein
MIDIMHHSTVLHTCNHRRHNDRAQAVEAGLGGEVDGSSVGAAVGALVGDFVGFLPHFPFPMHAGGLTGFMVGFFPIFPFARLRWFTSLCDDPASVDKWLDPRMVAAAGLVSAKARSERITMAAFMLALLCTEVK